MSESAEPESDNINITVQSTRVQNQINLWTWVLSESSYYCLCDAQCWRTIKTPEIQNPDKVQYVVCAAGQLCQTEKIQDLKTWREVLGLFLWLILVLLWSSVLVLCSCVSVNNSQAGNLLCVTSWSVRNMTTWVYTWQTGDQSTRKENAMDKPSDPVRPAPAAVETNRDRTVWQQWFTTNWHILILHLRSHRCVSWPR